MGSFAGLWAITGRTGAAKRPIVREHVNRASLDRSATFMVTPVCSRTGFAPAGTRPKDAGEAQTMPEAARALLRRGIRIFGFVCFGVDRNGVAQLFVNVQMDLAHRVEGTLEVFIQRSIEQAGADLIQESKPQQRELPHQFTSPVALAEPEVGVDASFTRI